MSTGLVLMFVALAVCLLIGVPVAFSIGISCMTLLYVNGGPSLDILLQRMVSGAKSFNMLAMPMFIFAGALMVYGSTPRLILAFIFLLLMVLGMFMETICIIILVTPILLPIAVSVGMTPLHFGIALLMSLMVGSLTPPLSVNLFTSCRVLGMKVDEAFPDTLYVIATVAIMSIITFAVPGLSEFLPALLGGGA